MPGWHQAWLCTTVFCCEEALFQNDACPVLLAGLDAFAALSVAAHLAALARGGGGSDKGGGCAVIIAIHQPRAEIWEMCDKVSPCGGAAQFGHDQAL